MIIIIIKISLQKNNIGSKASRLKTDSEDECLLCSNLNCIRYALYVYKLYVCIRSKEKLTPPGEKLVNDERLVDYSIQ